MKEMARTQHLCIIFLLAQKFGFGENLENGQGPTLYSQFIMKIALFKYHQAQQNFAQPRVSHFIIAIRAKST